MAPELFIAIDLASTTPVYRQIVDAIRVHLVSGRLAPDDQLPTVRELASDLGVHHYTVAEAYRQLAEEGWLVLGRRRGAIVQDKHRPARADSTATEQFIRRLNELIAQGLASGLKPREIQHLTDRALKTGGRK